MHVSKSLPVPHYTDIVKKLVFNFYVDDSIVKKLVLNLFVDYSAISLTLSKLPYNFIKSRNILWKKQTTSYENGLQIILNWKSFKWK